MNIRIAKIEDAASLIEFNQAMAMETEGKRLNTDILRNGVQEVFQDERKGFYVVAEEENAIIGGLLITFEWSDWRNAWFWWIQSVYISPAFRGRGIYRSLYEFILRKAAEKDDVCGFRLYVEKENVKARKVYEKLGMEESHYLMFEETKK